MSNCPNYEKCFPDFYHKTLADNLELAVETIERYCQNRYRFCARYAVYRHLPNAPFTLLPHQTREAQKIMIVSQYHNAANRVLSRYLP